MDPGHLSWLDENPPEWGKIYKPDSSLERRAVGNAAATLEGQVPQQAQKTTPGALQPEGKSVLKIVPKVCMPVTKSLAQRERDGL